MNCENISTPLVKECRPVFHDPNSLTVIQNDHAFAPDWVQFRFPKSRKKRIRNKWTKDIRNFRYEVGYKVIKADRMLIVSKKMYQRIMKLNTISFP